MVVVIEVEKPAKDVVVRRDIFVIEDICLIYLKSEELFWPRI